MATERVAGLPGVRERSRYDVIVVGGRVAGAATALLLARQGLRVLVLERSGAGTDTLSTLALMRAGVLQLKRWGLLERVRAAGTPALRRTLVHYGDEAVVVPVKEKAGVDELFAPRRMVLDTILGEAATEAGAEFRYESVVKELLWTDGSVSGVRGQDRMGRAFEARAPLVIGADGRHSAVARAVDAPLTWQSAVSGGVVYGFWSGLHVPGYEWFYRPGASAGLIPTNDGQVLVWVGTSTERFLREVAHDTTAGFALLVDEVGAGLGEMIASGRQEGRFRAFPGMSSYLRRPWGPGWALVGDAGSFRDPLSAHGISDALRDAEFLGRTVPAVLDAPSGDGTALAAYERTRDEAARPLAELTEAIASYRWTLADLEGLLKALSRAMGHEVEMLAGLDSPAPAGA
jgi:2-polyprenyl-6-methoxyphenol hydroxylase-like FAD-dependent oxidoreductase